MSVRTTVRYLRPLPQWNHIKPYQFAGDPPEGQLRDNLRLIPYAVDIFDARTTTNKPSLDTTGFEWIKHLTLESLGTEASILRNIDEMTSFLKQHLQAKHILVYQFQVCCSTK